MREVLFRGKRKDNGEWTYGYLLQDRYIAQGDAIFVMNSGDVVIDEYIDEVIPETVGQYTGLKDKNGNKIFEVDIVKFTDKTFGYSQIGEVCFDKGSFCILYELYGKKQLHRIGKTDKWQDMGASGTTTYSYKVIGNIYDNKNLLEEKL